MEQLGVSVWLWAAHRAKQVPGPQLLAWVCERIKSEASKLASLARPEWDGSSGLGAVPREG